MPGPAEFLVAASLLALMIIFRIVNMLHYRFDSDEPQHLHVIWGWVHGFVQYRDLFDNHMPLFHHGGGRGTATSTAHSIAVHWRNRFRFMIPLIWGLVEPAVSDYISGLSWHVGL